MGLQLAQDGFPCSPRPWGWSGSANLRTVYAPRSPHPRGRFDQPDDLTALAARTLDRIMAADSEWHDLWQGAAGDVNPASVAVCGLRRVLTA
ncbi:DUF4259 domain-containing protein [Micromonospora sp. NBC_01796]|uniref:DUF4259 domain-containing protein n=1 Tax=Micromonospora sp. NBC_01796 TaxID=2975987 RepID=UPI002DD848C7|nr:DUF4259 domain-containing protein [Micromonospora sp. NBC_01796]